MRGRKLRALRTDGASKSRMIEPSFFLNYPSKNQKNPLASTPTAITAGEANHPPPKKATLLGSFLFLSDIKKKFHSRRL